MKNLHIMLDATTHKKLKTFAFENDVSKSEVVRVLLKKSKLKIKTRDKQTIDKDSKQDRKTNTFENGIYLSDEIFIKIKKMRMSNDASNAEIIRQLITNTDLSTLKFKTKGENILAGKSKKK
jgi:hypothetical protein